MVVSGRILIVREYSVLFNFRLIPPDTIVIISILFYHSRINHLREYNTGYYYPKVLVGVVVAELIFSVLVKL